LQINDRRVPQRRQDERSEMPPFHGVNSTMEWWIFNHIIVDFYPLSFEEPAVSAKKELGELTQRRAL